MPDLTLKCANCGQEFLFSEGEQRFYQEKGLPQPQLCLICRATKKAQEQQFQPYRHKTHPPKS